MYNEKLFWTVVSWTTYGVITLFCLSIIAIVIAGLICGWKEGEKE